MPTAEDGYTESMFEQFGYLATWLPNTPLALGSIGVLQGRTFVPKSSIHSFGVEFSASNGEQNGTSLQFQSSKDIKVDVKLAGSVSASVPTLPAGQAGAAVSFGAGSGVVFSARGVRIRRISDVIALEAALWDLWDRYLWDKDWVVITELVEAERASVLVSEGGYGRIELGVSGEAQAGPLDIGDLSGELSVVSSYGMHTQLVSERGLTPLFRAIRIKKSLFGAKVTGVRAVAPPSEPGVIPRRGGPLPEGRLTEEATD
jgi:hypothetical protein